MRNKNTLLAAAITATLSMMNQAAYATDMKNCITAASCNTATVNVPTTGLIYGSHLFDASSGGNVILPSSGLAGVAFDVEGTINFGFEFEVKLSNGAKFNDHPLLTFFSNTAAAAATVVEPNPNCANKSECSWTIDVTGEIQDVDLFYLVYNLTNASALKTPGETIKMTSDWTSIGTGDPARGLEVTLATSKDPLTVTLEPGTETTTRVSVSSNNTEFTSTSTTTTEFLNSNEAVIGYLSIKNDTSVAAADGKTVDTSTPPVSVSWDLGNTGFEAGFDADTSIETTLTIDSGQFASSLTASTGSVYIGLPGLVSGSIDVSTKIKATSVTSTTAIWELSNSNLQDITDMSDGVTTNGEGKPVIVIETDGTNPVNIEENPPNATLVIDYVDENSQKDVTYGPTELTDFRQDGTRCWVYNVPPPSTEGVADTFNLRITNDSSSVAGTILGTLYPMGGESTGLTNPVFTSVNLLGEGVELGAYQTVRITADDLTALGGDTPYVWWESGNRRGTLLITSTLPKLEILTLMRDTNADVLTNVSTGAHGSACQN